MDDPLSPRPEDGEPTIADAASLFGEPAPKSRPSPPPPPKAPADPGDYELDEAPEVAPRPRAVIPVETPAAEKTPPRRPAERKEPAARVEKTARPEPAAAVDEVWSRGAEWGGTIALLALTSVGLLVLFYVLLQMELYTLLFVAFVGALPVLVAVGYPILITLERPVRMTPEQAIRDYFSALSHHGPHYRRMWLLLSNAGRVSGSFASFEGFRSYWKTRLGELRAAKAGSFTPLKFQVDGFTAPKSHGLETIEAKYTVNVFVRGRTDAGPVASIPMVTSLVKGPDKMWYLNRGTLP